MERRQHELREERFRRARESLAERLRVICSGLGEKEREALFDRMAAIEIKYILRRTPWPPEPAPRTDHSE